MIIDDINDDRCLRDEDKDLSIYISLSISFTDYAL